MVFLTALAVPASASVITIDPGGNSIQAAIDGASSGDVIVLDPGVYYQNGMTIAGKDLTFRAAAGHGPSDTIIDGSSVAPRLFTVTDGSSLAIENLALRNGQAGTSGLTGNNGGAISSQGQVTVNASTITGCSAGNGGTGSSGDLAGGGGGAGGNGGAIYADDFVTISGTTIAQCTAGSGGYGGSGWLESSGPGGPGGSGGAVYGNAVVNLTASSVTGCRAGNGGRGGDTDNTGSNLPGCNGGRGGDGGSSGAIFASGTVMLTGTNVSGCSAGNGGDGGDAGDGDYDFGDGGDGGNGGSGGAIISNNFVMISASSVTSCSAGIAGIGGVGRDSDYCGTNGQAGDGGAILSAGPVVIDSSAISLCSAGRGRSGDEDHAGCAGGNGGAVYGRADVSLAGSTISQCTAGGGGGGGPGNWAHGQPGGAGGSGGAVWAPEVHLADTGIYNCSAGAGGKGGDGNFWICNDGDGGVGGPGGAGGAVVALDSATLSGTTISGCSAGNGGQGGEGSWTGDAGSGGAGGNGGAILAPGPVTLNMSSIVDCTDGSGGNGGGGGWLGGDDGATGPSGNGGGIYSGSSVSIESSALSTCYAVGGNGGAVYTTYQITANNSTFTGCVAWVNGGALFAANGGVGVSNSTFDSCSASGNGGGIYALNGVTAYSSTFTGNKAVSGSAVYGRGGPVRFCRLTGNSGTAIYSPGRTFDATDNWWGSNADPSANVNSVVSTSPWLVLGASAVPALITVGQTSSVQANLTVDSAGEYHDPALGHVPDNIPASFAMTSGPGAVSGSAKTAAGVAQALFTSSATGTARVTATVDSQTAPAVIEITQAIALSASPAPSVYGLPVAFTGTVTPGPATGTVQFKIDGSPFGSPVTLSGGSATSESISTLSVGTHTVEADYSGETSCANAITVTVVPQVYDAQILAVNCPATMVRQGDVAYTINVTVQNTGNMAWNLAGDGYDLKMNDNDELPGAGVVKTCNLSVVSPGQAVLYTYNVTPYVAASDPGPEDCVASFRMTSGAVPDGYFGAERSASFTTVEDLGARIVSIDCPSTMRALSSYNIYVTVQNTGLTPWLYTVNGSGLQTTFDMAVRDDVYGQPDRLLAMHVSTARNKTVVGSGDCVLYTFTVYPTWSDSQPIADMEHNVQFQMTRTSSPLSYFGPSGQAAFHVVPPDQSPVTTPTPMPAATPTPGPLNGTAGNGTPTPTAMPVPSLAPTPVPELLPAAVIALAVTGMALAARGKRKEGR